MNQRPLCVPCLLAAFICTRFLSTAGAADLRVYEQGQLPNDDRMQDPKDLNGYFPFEVPEGEALWEARAGELRRRVQIATGLWPMPERTPLNPVIHGKVERDGFTVEKVYFESVPGHFVTGLLFRPENVEGEVPGVLCPHGHGGRLQDYGADRMAELIESGAERFERSGRYPKLARCAQLARMGCVVFIFDMLGYADSVQLSRELVHGFRDARPDFEGTESWGLFSTQAEMRMQSVMGIQTWNSVRALDFLDHLPDVDPARLAVTGGSGGGTQTILLGAIDSRPIAAFPQGMVSTSMQGGCTCENCCLLRIGTGNVELAALFAPRPQAMTSADDWTREMMTKGYPELQRLYAMLGVPDNVLCEPFLHFPHNYNAVSRGIMYSWFNEHLGLGLEEPIEEADYEPLTPEEYTVWNDDHPKPDGVSEHGPMYELALTAYLAEQSDRQMAALTPNDVVTLREFRGVVGGAFETIIGRGLPSPDEIQREKIDKEEGTGYIYFEDIIRLQSQGEEFPVISLFPTGTEWNGEVVIWVDGAGKRGMFDNSGQPRTEVLRLLDGGLAVLSADLFEQGEFLLSQSVLTGQRVVGNSREFAGYTFAYNDTLFARRVHDILTLISWVRHDDHAPQELHLIGVHGGGPLVAAARAIAGDQVDRAAVDTGGFRFSALRTYRDPNFLPGAVKYGDLPALLALSAPHALWIGGEQGEVPEVVERAYLAAGEEGAVSSSSLQTTNDAAVEWLLAR